MSQSSGSAPEQAFGNGGILTVVGVIVTFALFIAGIWLMGAAFENPGYEFITFAGGIIAIALSVAVPIHLIAKFDGSTEIDTSTATGRRHS